MSNKLKYAAIIYDQDEETYGYGSLEKFIRRNTVNRNKPKPQAKKRRSGRRKKPIGRKIENRYAIIDPNNLEFVRFFDSIVQLENYTGLKALWQRLHLYKKYQLGPRTSPVIGGFIVVGWKERESMGMDREELEEMLHKKVVGWELINVFERMRRNITSISPDTLKKMLDYLLRIEKDN